MATKAKPAAHGSKAKKELDKAAEAKAGESSEGRVFPESEANTATDHARSATEIAAQVSPAAAGTPQAAAQANAAQIDETSAKLDARDEKRQEDEDKSIFGKIARSGLVHNKEHVYGNEWVGPSIQSEGPEFNHLKGKCSVNPLTTVAPRTGMLVRPDGLTGDSFTVGEGFNVDSKPDDWAKVVNPSDGKALFG